MVRKFLKQLGLHPAPALAEHKTWLSWYQGDVKGFHDYTMNNGKKVIKRKRDGMNMAKQVCQDWASLLLNEKVEVTSADAGLSDVLKDVFDFNAFRFRANQLLELTFALGTGAFVEYADSDGQTVIDYVRGDCIYPLSWDNGEITECAFASLRQIDGKGCYYINVHQLESGSYIVRNYLIDEKGGKRLELPEGVLEEVTTNSVRPRFQIIQPNIVNNVDLDSPYGISVYANAIGRLKKVDLIFDSGNNEFSLGKKRIIVPENMTTTTIGASLDRPIFDPNDVAFYSMNIHDPSGQATQKPIDLTGQLRIQEHSLGLQDALNYLSEGVGLGTGRYEFRDGGAKTATEVVSEKSDLYQNLKRHELVLEKALRDLCAVIAEMNGHNPDAEISVNFDDSIITDRDQDIEQAIKLTSAGLKSKLSAIAELYGLTEDEAKKELEKINAESMPPSSDQQDLFGRE